MTSELDLGAALRALNEIEQKLKQVHALIPEVMRPEESRVVMAARMLRLSLEVRVKGRNGGRLDNNALAIEPASPERTPRESY